MSDELIEKLHESFPWYLTTEDKRDLYAQFKSFPKHKGYYLPDTIYPDLLLQGDGWDSFIVRDIETGEMKLIRGIIISNSCDIDPANGIRIGQKILCAPIIKLKYYLDALMENGHEQEQIDSIVRDIRDQRISYIFHLPERAGIMDESIVLLDDVNSNPLLHYLEKTKKSKIFCLNQFGFYLFIIKISIHFTRLREELRRYEKI